MVDCSFVYVPIGVCLHVLMRISVHLYVLMLIELICRYSSEQVCPCGKEHVLEGGCPCDRKCVLIGGDLILYENSLLEGEYPSCPRRPVLEGEAVSLWEEQCPCGRGLSMKRQDLMEETCLCRRGLCGRHASFLEGVFPCGMRFVQ